MGGHPWAQCCWSSPPISTLELVRPDFPVACTCAAPEFAWALCAGTSTWLPLHALPSTSTSEHPRPSRTVAHHQVPTSCWVLRASSQVRAGRICATARTCLPPTSTPIFFCPALQSTCATSVPLTVLHCRAGGFKYAGTPIHRIVKHAYIQGGDVVDGTGTTPLVLL